MPGPKLNSPGAADWRLCGGIACALVSVLLHAPATAQALDDNVAAMMAEGWRRQTTHVIINRSTGAKIRELPQGESRSPALARILDLAEQRFANSPSRALLIAQKGKVVLERYASGKVDALSTPIGNSMSKSLVSLAVGKALCAGAIPSLETPAQAIVPQLAATSWGESSIRDLLLMTSGAFFSDPQTPTGWKNEDDIRLNRAVYSRQLATSYLDLMRRMDSRQFRPGSTFNYNNYDTIALNIAVERSTGRPFSKYFEETIWDAVGPEAPGAWVTNQPGEVAGYFGFSATSRDWLRIGLFVLEAMGRDDCFGQYLRAATREQVIANWPINKSYGYQIWTNCTAKSGSFCFVGNHGQQLIIHPATQTVLYVHAIDGRTNRLWRELFEMLPA